jgi:perosamine synthetase
MMIPHSRPSIGEAEAHAVADVIRSGQLAAGPHVEAFEVGVAKLIGVAGGVAVTSGTAALELALRGLGVGSGDEVLMPSYVCPAPWLAATRVGARARLVEIDPVSYAIDPLEAAKLTSRRTRAIIVPHLFGLPADLTALQALGVPLIEDCAQTLGATEAGRPVGTVGTVSICSFYATKLICAGEGGMVLSNDRELLDRVRALRQYDEQPRLRSDVYNYKMTDLQAAVGFQQLRRFPSLIERRRAIAARYDAAFATLGVSLPEIPKGRTHVYYRYVMRLKVRRGKSELDAVLRALEERGVCGRRPVFHPLHRYVEAGPFIQTDQAMMTALSVPLYPGLSEEEVTQVITRVSQVLADPEVRV